MIEVSLGIPAFNSSGFLDGLFAGLLRLDPAPREIVLLDDGSADDTFRRMQDFAVGAGARLAVRALRNEANLGVAGSYNRLARELRGEWAHLLDVDDLPVDADFYARLAPALGSGADLVLTPLTSNSRLLACVARLLVPLMPLRPPAWIPLLGSSVTRSGVLYRRRLLVENPFPDPGYTGSDIIHLLELRMAHPAVFVRQARVHYRVHAASLSSGNRDATRYRAELRRLPWGVRSAHRIDLRLRQFGQWLAR